jgi:hypothetical protein
MFPEQPCTLRVCSCRLHWEDGRGGQPAQGGQAMSHRRHVLDTSSLGNPCCEAPHAFPFSAQPRRASIPLCCRVASKCSFPDPTVADFTHAHKPSTFLGEGEGWRRDKKPACFLGSVKRVRHWDPVPDRTASSMRLQRLDDKTLVVLWLLPATSQANHDRRLTLILSLSHSLYCRS